MYRLTIEGVFSAAHAIRMDGSVEPLHGHDWRVVVGVEGERLDEDGLLCDFHAIERALADITGRFHNANLNETSPFDTVNPTAEHVAKHIGEALSGRLDLGDAHLASVRVSEAPGCTATWVRDGKDEG